MRKFGRRFSRQRAILYAEEAKAVDVNGVSNVIRLMHFARIGEIVHSEKCTLGYRGGEFVE